MSVLMETLIGRVVHGLWVADGSTRLIFETDQGDLAFVAEGDCCSTSWFNDIIGVAAFEHALVRAAETWTPDPPDNTDGYECLQVYGVKLTTESGYVDILFRNESNGYYGGYLEDTANTSLDGATRITRDWSADDPIRE